jgi:RNA recognition motif. (a.k.a. RRM, RBD, or RNP domain)
MSRGYGQGKRQREDEQSRKRQDKERRRMEKRETGPRSVPIEGLTQIEASPSVEDIMRSLERGAGTERSAAALPSRLFVGGLSDDVTEQVLAGAFGQFGPVADCIVMRDRDSRMPRGFGFVTMADRKDAPRAIAALHGSELLGRTLVVNVATDRPR